MAMLSTDLKALKRRGYYNGQYAVHTCPRVALRAYVSLVDKILKQRQQDRNLNWRKQRGEAATPDRRRPVLRRPSFPSQWRHNPGEPTRPILLRRAPSHRRGALDCLEPGSLHLAHLHPPTTPRPEQPRNELVTPRPPTSPSTPEPTNNAHPVGNALQNLRRKLVPRVKAPFKFAVAHWQNRLGWVGGH